MDINEFIKNFAEQFDETDASEFKADTKFKDLEEWSSMIALSVIAMIDTEYDVQVRGADVRSASTIADLFNKVAEMKK